MPSESPLAEQATRVMRRLGRPRRLGAPPARAAAHYNELYVFSPESGAWAALSPSGPAPSPRQSMGFAAAPGGTLYAFGGSNIGGEGSGPRGGACGCAGRAWLRAVDLVLQRDCADRVLRRRCCRSCIAARLRRSCIAAQLRRLCFAAQLPRSYIATQYFGR